MKNKNLDDPFYENNSRLVDTKVRLQILEEIQMAFIKGEYPESLNHPLMRDLNKLITDAREKTIHQRLISESYD